MRRGPATIGRLAVVTAVALAASCGARTVLDPSAPPSDAAAADTTPLDGGEPGDGTVRDAPPDRFMPPPDAEAPAPCRRDADCRGVCQVDRRVAPADLLALPLVCGAPRPGGDAGAFCDVGEECARGICLVAGTCVEACVDDGDCAPGQRCQSVFAVTSSAALQPLSGCVDRANPPEEVRVEHEVLTQALSGGLDTIDLVGASATSLRVLEPLQDVRLVVERLSTRDAMSAVLFDMFLLSLDSPPPRNPVASTGIPVGILIPNSDRSVVTPNGYEIRVRARGTSDLMVTTLVRTAPGSTLGVDLFYVGGGGLSPTGDPRGPPMVEDALDELERIWGARGIRLGDVRQHEVVGMLRQRYAIIEGEQTGMSLEWPEMGDLFALSAGVGRPSVSVFLVRIVDGALAVSGGAPGPQTLHGTSGSGIVVAVDALGAPGLPPGLDMGRALSHELGHFLGLFHTSERNGFVIEPISDTPECRRDRDADGDGFLSATECEGLGAENLMYWAASGEDLSTMQGQIAGAAMVLR